MRDTIGEDWEGRLLHQLRRFLVKQAIVSNTQPKRVHLAVMIEPYLSELLAGRKTIESRFTMTRKAPYQQAEAGDVVLLKRSSGPVVGICTIIRADFYELTPKLFAKIRRNYGKAICARGNDFWQAKQKMRYASLLHVDHVHPTPPTSCAKSDQRGWAVIREI